MSKQKRTGFPPYADLAGAGMSEDDRIQQIGRHAMAGNVTAFIVDDVPGKVDRYISKLVKAFPEITRWKILGKFTKGSVAVKVYPPGNTEDLETGL